MLSACDSIEARFASYVEKDEDEEMSDQGFKGVPGVPEGWELVRFDYAVEGERYLTGTREIVVHLSTKPTLAARLIIRKIEVPKQWRKFANGAEYIAKRLEGIAVDWKYPDRAGGFYAVVSANYLFVWVAFGKTVEQFCWEQAFGRLVFRHIDGSTSPFGVEVASE
jgi:hypothetical protein